MDPLVIAIIVIGVGIGLFTIIMCCKIGCSYDDEDDGELENFQTININIKGYS